jgi:hypothetical protein
VRQQGSPEMKLIWTIITIVGLWVLTTPSRANTVRDDEPSKITAFSNRLIEFKKDLNQITGRIIWSVVSEPEPTVESRKTMLCMTRIQTQTDTILAGLWGVWPAISISSTLHDPVDEFVTLRVVEHTLATTDKFLKTARSEMNEIFGGCGRLSPVAYDKAKVLMGLVEEIGMVIRPMLSRVKAAIEKPLLQPPQ